MGCNQSAEQAEQKDKNSEINKAIAEDKAKGAKEVKMLLLGAGESGKSTILKQMTVLYGKGYSEQDRLSYREIVFSNVVQSMKVVMDAMDSLGIQFQNPDNLVYKTCIVEQPAQIEGDVLAPEIVTAIKCLWNDEGVKSCFARSREYQLNDSSSYYFDGIDRIGASDFIPSEQDVLRSRVKTTGITETTFAIRGYTYRLFDVGGQRSERKKWIHCFEDVTAIVFLAACSEYDQVLLEDESTNRVQEALTLFDSICNSRWFVKTSVILFLNKTDLFKEKIKKVPLSKYYPEYTGDDSYEQSIDFILQKFLILNQSKEKQIYSHLTCATDTQNMSFVMNAVNDMILRNNMRDMGIV